MSSSHDLGADRFALIARVARIITSGLELEALLQNAADAIHDLLHYHNVDIPLVDPEDPGILVVRNRGGLYKRLIRDAYWGKQGARIV